MVLIPTLATGIGIPTFSAWLSGDFPTSIRDTEKVKKIIIGSVVGIMVAGLAFMATAAPPVPPAAIVPPAVSKSVSDVTVQLGRYAGGIDYPGQIRDVAVEGVYSDSSLIFVD